MYVILENSESLMLKYRNWKLYAHFLGILKNILNFYNHTILQDSNFIPNKNYFPPKSLLISYYLKIPLSKFIYVISLSNLITKFPLS